MGLKKNITFMCSLVLTSVLFASGCDGEVCSFKSKDKPAIFYGSSGAYELWESENDEDEVFVNLGTKLAEEALLRSLPDAATLMVESNKIEELCDKLKSKEVKFEVYKIKDGKLITVVNDAFVKAWNNTSATSKDLKEWLVKGKIGSKDVTYKLSYENSASTYLFLNAIGVQLRDVEGYGDIISYNELNEKSKEIAKELAEDKKPIIYVTNSALYDKYMQDKEWKTQGLKKLEWSDAPNVAFIVVVLKSNHKDEIIASLKRMNAKLICGN
jgi:hypothetical protein